LFYFYDAGGAKSTVLIASPLILASARGPPRRVNVSRYDNELC